MNTIKHFFHNTILCVSRFAVGQVRIFYVSFKKILLGVGKSKGRGAAVNKKTEGEMYSTAQAELRNISSTEKWSKGRRLVNKDEITWGTTIMPIDYNPDAPKEWLACYTKLNHRGQEIRL